MARVYACMSMALGMLLIGSAVLGIADPRPTPDRHLILAILTLLFGCLLQVVTFTYFSVTAKMMAQALHLMKADLAPLLEAKQHRKSATSLLALTIFSLLGITVTGAVHWRTSSLREFHWLAAIGVMIVHGWVSFVQYGLINRNSVVLARTLQDYAESTERQRRSTQEGQKRPPAPHLQTSPETI